MSEHNHDDMILLHENMFKNIEKTLDELVQADKARNGRYDKHLEESIEYRGIAKSNINRITNIEARFTEIRVWAIGIIGTLIGCAFWLGARFHELDWLVKIHDSKTTVQMDGVNSLKP